MEFHSFFYRRFMIFYMVKNWKMTGKDSKFTRKQGKHVSLQGKTVFLKLFLASQLIFHFTGFSLFVYFWKYSKNVKLQENTANLQEKQIKHHFTGKNWKSENFIYFVVYALYDPQRTNSYK